MRPALPILPILLAGLLAHAVPDAEDQPCSFTCPPADQLGFLVGQKDENSDPIFCSYPAIEGEDFCTYSKTTGALVTDNDAGSCLPNAVQGSGCLRRRINALPRRSRRRSQSHED